MASSAHSTCTNSGSRTTFAATASRTGRWELVHDRVYRIVGTPLTWRGQVLAACWAGGMRAVASHRTAAELWRLPGRSTTVVEITCPRWRRAQPRRPDRPRVARAGRCRRRGRRRRHSDDDACNGRSSTSPASYAHVTSSTSPSRTRSGVGLTTRVRAGADAEAARHGEDVPERSSSAAPSSCICPHAALTESDAEHRVAAPPRATGFPTPVPQYEIRDTDGRLVARVDFAYPERKIAIEYDSYAHHLGTDAHDRDSARRNAIVGAGVAPDHRDGERREERRAPPRRSTSRRHVTTNLRRQRRIVRRIPTHVRKAGPYGWRRRRRRRVAMRRPTAPMTTR